MPRSPNWSTIDPSFQTQSFWTSTWTPSNPGSGFWTDGSTVINASNVKSSGTRTYAVTPGFFNPNRVGPLAPLGFQGEFRESSADGYSRTFDKQVVNDPSSSSWYEIVTNDNTVRTHNVFVVGNLPDALLSGISDLDRKARQKTLENLKGMSVNIAQATAEREQTVKTVTSAAKAIAGVLTNLRKGNFAGAAGSLGISPPKRGHRKFRKEYANDTANAVGNGWLALQYGWKPLLNDVYGSVEALAKAKVGTNMIFFVASGQSQKKFEEKKRVVTSPPSGYSGTNITYQEYDGFGIVRYKIKYSRSSASVSNLASLGITNPLLLAWELIPYSFVADWFVPIGGFLGALDATLGLSFLSGYSVSFQKSKFHNIREVNQFRSSPLSTTTRHNTEFSKIVKVNRVILSGFPEVPLPSFKNPLSMSHLASAMALLKQFKR
jgi:hypothetical protein